MKVKKVGFTLIELLVVIAIIGLLFCMILPVLSKSRQKARQTLCASMLRQYALATQYYVNEWKYYPDAQAYLRKETGFLGYFDKDKEVWPERVVRCPGDEKTEELGRLGSCVQGTVSVKVSIGLNGNNCSDTISWRSTGPVAQWLRPEDLKGAMPNKVSMWMDYQFQLPYINGEGNPLTAPVMKNATAGILGRYAFRHNNAMNTTFLDGHVGFIRLLLSTVNYGHDFASGATWTAGKLPNHVLLPFGARPANASMYPNGFLASPDVTFE